jgi:hypothetical protein
MVPSNKILIFIFIRFSQLEITESATESPEAWKSEPEQRSPYTSGSIWIIFESAVFASRHY